MNWMQRWLLKQGVKHMGNWFQKFLKGELGWKTITGAALILTSLILQATGNPEWADGVLRLGEAVGLIGLRDAVSKLPL